MKTGLIDVGGGLRGVYAAGVLDRCLDEGVRFDYGIGISAGSANLASFLAGQRGRNLRFFRDYSQRKAYMGLGNFLRGRGFLDLQYIYGTLSVSGGEDPLDYPSIAANPTEWYVAAAEAGTGKPHYFRPGDLHQDDYRILMASSAIQVVCPAQVIGGVPYYDGALGDPVPVEKAFADGCDRVVLLLTKPEGEIRRSDTDGKLAKRLEKRYPAAAEGLRRRAERYNRGVALAQDYARQGKLLIVAPDDTCGVRTLSRDRDALLRLYEKGLRDGQKIPAFLRP